MGDVETMTSLLLLVLESNQPFLLKRGCYNVWAFHDVFRWCHDLTSTKLMKWKPRVSRCFPEPKYVPHDAKSHNPRLMTRMTRSLHSALHQAHHDDQFAIWLDCSVFIRHTQKMIGPCSRALLRDRGRQISPYPNAESRRVGAKKSWYFALLMTIMGHVIPVNNEPHGLLAPFHFGSAVPALPYPLPLPLTHFVLGISEDGRCSSNRQ